MATSQSSTLSEALRKLEEQLTCSICLEQYTNPKILPCSHSFCLSCLRCVLQDLTKQGNYSLPCPICKSPCQLPDQGVDVFPPSFTINNLTEVYNLMKKVQHKGHTSCDSCDNTEADRYCKQCAKFLCQQCLQQHDKWTNNHKTLNLNEVALPTVTAVTISFDHIPIVGEESTVNISLSLEDGSPASIPLSLINCHLTPPTSPSSLVECTVKETSLTGQYHVVFTPCIEGSHQLHVKLQDRTIPGNSVSIPVTMRGSVVKTITGLKGPHGVAVSDDGQVIISESDGHCVTIVTRDEERVTFGYHGGWSQLDTPCGIAITSMGTILVINNGNYCIQQFTVDGECISCVGSEGNGPLQFDYPRGIAINKTTGQVYVAELANHRVQVLNADLTFSHMFGSRGSDQGQFDYPFGVAIDSQGFVYVADCNNHRIQKFTPEGWFVSSFGSKGSESDQLFKPRFISINNDLLYVSEGDPNHRISVYTITGEYVHCFGEGSLQYPTGLAMDTTTGYLYVCDKNVGSIHVFNH